MDIIPLVTTSLEYYDSNNIKYNKLFKLKSYPVDKSMLINGDSMMVFLDNEDNELFRLRYEYIGLVINEKDSNIWIWSWNLPSIPKNQTNIARKIWNYGATLDLSNSYGETLDVYNSNIYLKTELTTARIVMTDDIQLDIHLAIASYIGKQPLIYKYKSDGPNNSIYTHCLFLLDYDKIN